MAGPSRPIRAAPAQWRAQPVVAPRHSDSQTSRSIPGVTPAVESSHARARTHTPRSATVQMRKARVTACLRARSSAPKCAAAAASASERTRTGGGARRVDVPLDVAVRLCVKLDNTQSRLPVESSHTSPRYRNSCLGFGGGILFCKVPLAFPLRAELLKR